MIEKCLFYIMILFLIIYTFKITKMWNIHDIFKSNSKNIGEGFSNKEKIKREDKFKKEFKILSDEIPCEPTLLEQAMNKFHAYIPFISYSETSEYLLLTNSSTYSTNLKYVKNYDEYINFIPQNMDLDSLVEQLSLNVYTYEDKKHTDLIAIVPEYYLDDIHLKSKKEEDYEYEEEYKYEEYKIKDKLITHSDDKETEKINLRDYVRYIGGVSYTYYYFLIPPTSSNNSNIFSIYDHEFSGVIFIVYDEHTIPKTSSNIELSDKNKNLFIEKKLQESYSKNNQLNFIKDYIKYLRNSYNQSRTRIDPLYLTEISFKPIYINDLPEENIKIILGSNEYSQNILNKLGFGHSSIKYNILGFDEHANTMFTEHNIDNDDIKKREKYKRQREKYRINVIEEEDIQNLYKDYGKSTLGKDSPYLVGEKDTLNFDKYVEDQHLDNNTYIERKTKMLLKRYKLNNTLIENIHVHEVHADSVIKCDMNNTPNDARARAKNAIKIERLNKAGYSTECIVNRLEKQLPSTNHYFPIKTFLFRNVAIAHKYTNEKFVYNLLYLYMKKIRDENKFKLLSLNTNIELHKGAEDFYRNYGFITNIKNVDCLYSVGKKSCEVRNRYRHAP